MWIKLKNLLERKSRLKPAEKNNKTDSSYFSLPPLPFAVDKIRRYRWYVQIPVLLLSLVLIIATTLLATPVLKTKYDLALAIPGFLVAFVLVFVAFWHTLGTGRKVAPKVVFIVYFFIIGIFGIGLSQTIIINNKPYLATSQVAESYRLSTTLATAIYSLTDYYALIDASTAVAKTKYQDFAIYEQESLAISNTWLNYSKPVPLAAYSSIITTVGNAASLENKTLILESQNIVTPDPNLAEAIKNNKASIVDDISSAARALGQISTFYNFTLRSNNG